MFGLRTPFFRTSSGIAPSVLAAATLFGLSGQAQANQWIAGSHIQIYYGHAGQWVDSVTSKGLQINNGGWQDVTYPGSPWSQVTIEYDYLGSPRRYEANDGRQDFTTLLEDDRSSGATNESQYSWSLTGLEIEKVEVWEDSGKILTMTFQVRNVGTGPITDFRLMHGMDPDQDYYPHGDYNTYNDVSTDGSFATSEGGTSRFTVGYGVCDPSRQDVGHTAGWESDADAAFVDSGGGLGDWAMHIRHIEPTIAVGDTVVFAFAFVIGTNKSDADTRYHTEGCGGCWDWDGDFFEDSVCGGSDCDDSDPLIYPGAAEYCNGLDDDCDVAIDEAPVVDPGTFYPDNDEDSFGRTWGPRLACDPPAGYVEDHTDCDDTDPDVHPGAPEIPYDGIDQDCDGFDLGDVDGDGHLKFPFGGDCNDMDATVNPDMVEVANGKDDDCDGLVDEDTEWSDDDHDGYTEAGGDCDDAQPTVNPGARERCDALDNDCNGWIDERTDCYDDDRDGFTEDEGDCNDRDPLVHPDAIEVMGDGIDNDCNGVTDNGTTDHDGDGFSDFAGDCDDANPDVYPGAPELEDGIDNDCDDWIDEGTDLSDDDADGFSEADGDCDDSNSTVYPGAPDIPNGIDDDCDGSIDENTSVTDDDGDGVTEDGGDCDDGDPNAAPGMGEVHGDGVDNDCDGEVDESEDADGDGYTSADGDCDDANGWAHPGMEELCDTFDNNCDGEIDERCRKDNDKATPKNFGCNTAPGLGGAGWLFYLLPLALRRRRPSEGAR
jgi:hypothetical protein